MWAAKAHGLCPYLRCLKSWHRRKQAHCMLPRLAANAVAQQNCSFVTDASDPFGLAGMPSFWLRQRFSSSSSTCQWVVTGRPASPGIKQVRHRWHQHLQHHLSLWQGFAADIFRSQQQNIVLRPIIIVFFTKCVKSISSVALITADC